jgi:hypothetical protein
VSNLSRDIRALSRDVAVLRAELEQYRTELREVLDRFLEECSYGGPGRTATSAAHPALRCPAATAWGASAMTTSDLVRRCGRCRTASSPPLKRQLIGRDRLLRRMF